MASDLMKPKQIQIDDKWLTQYVGIPQGSKNGPRFFNEYFDTCLTIFHIKYGIKITKGMIADDLITFHKESIE